MVKKKTKTQTDLYGNPVNEQDFKKRIHEIEEKINPLEDPTEFDHDFWEKKAKKFKKLGDQERELQVYNKFIEKSGFTSPYVLRKGTLLVDMGEFDEALKILKSLYGCESHDTIVAPAQLQMARASAIQGKKDDMIEYLKKAMRTTIFFAFSSGHYSKCNLIKDIKQTPEFDKYRDTEEFQEVLNFEWEREDEIKLENKMKHYLSEKQINPELIDPIRLRLIEYLLAYSESDVYLDFNFGLNWLVNSSNSILIVKDEMLDFQGIVKGRAHYAEFNFSQDKLTSIRHLDIPNKTYHIKDVVYNKADVETVLKIFEGHLDVDILEEPNALIISDFPYPQIIVIVFPSSSNSRESIMEFLEINGSHKFFEIVKIIKKNYPENLIDESLKEPFDANRYQDIDPLKASFKALLDKIKSEIDETKDNYMKLEILLEYVQIYFSYLSKEESKIFTNFVKKIIAILLRESSIDDIKALISLPKEILRTLLESAGVDYYYYGSDFFDLIRDKIEMIDDDYTKLRILIYFDKHGGGVNPNFEKMLRQEIKTQFIKAEVSIIKSLLEQKYVRRLSKAERTEVIKQINLDGLRKHLSIELESWNRTFEGLYFRIPSKGNILLFELLYNFSKYKVQIAKTILNKELEDNITRFNGQTLKQLIKNKYFSFMKPERVNKISANINFEQFFTELSFIRAVQLLERLSKLGYKNAQETIKDQALKLALNNEVNTATKTFKKYVSDEELAVVENKMH